MANIPTQGNGKMPILICVGEIWKDLIGYEGVYFVSNLGRIRTNQLIRKQAINKRGYSRITLSKCHKKYSHVVHRLVARSFIENPCNKPEINHKNGVKTDNRTENLEWCTRLENEHHAFAMGLKIAPVKPVGQYKDNHLIKKFPSLKAAVAAVGLPLGRSDISACCRGIRKYCKGFEWKFI